MGAIIMEHVLPQICVSVRLGGWVMIAVYPYANRLAFIMETAHILILVHVNAVGLGMIAVLHYVRKSVKMEVIVWHPILVSA